MTLTNGMFQAPLYLIVRKPASQIFFERLESPNSMNVQESEAILNDIENHGHGDFCLQPEEKISFYGCLTVTQGLLFAGSIDHEHMCIYIYVCYIPRYLTNTCSTFIVHYYFSHT